MLPAAVNGAALLRPSAIHADEQACRALSALAARLTRAGTQLQHGSQLQGSAPQAPFLFFVSALDDERREEQPPSGLLRHLHTRHAVIPGAVYDRWQRQALYPWAARPHLGVPLDITGRRHISFMRFLSGSAQQRFVPDAEDADAALRDYQELKARLDKIQRPSTLKTTQQMLKEAAVAIGKGVSAVFRFALSIPGRLAALATMSPSDWAKWWKGTWVWLKEEAHHFWVGLKLLGYEIRIASRHALKAAQGKTLSRRERTQLTRTTADLFRLVPMIIIVVVPLLEFALPIILKLFPNILPSTFEDKLKKEEELKRRLAVRLELARFLQDTVAEMAKDIARRKGSSADADDLFKFIEKVRAGQEVDNAEIIKFARLFNDELTLDNLERVQLVTMCQFVGINPFGTDAYLRSRLRQHLREIKQDDYEIEQEGLENMTEEELRAACRARGMRAFYGEGATKFMQRQMQDWLDLSLHRGLPSSLLLLSRAFTITAQDRVGKDVSEVKDKKYEKLKETLSVIPGEVVDSVAIQQLGTTKTGVEAMEQKLQFLHREEEAIKAESKRAEEAAKVAAAQEAAMRTAIKMGDMPVAAAAAAPEAAAAAAAQPALAITAAPVAAAATGSPAAAATASPAANVVAPEEAAAAAKEQKDKRVKAIISSLMDMATRSGVAKERAIFMGLMRKEIDRVNSVLSESGGKGSSTGFLQFGSEGLTVAKEKVGEGETQPEPSVVAQAIPSSLSERVSRMLTSIEAELDRVEVKIGGRLHVLDQDNDGRISDQEIEKALSYLRDQLSPEEMSEVLANLRDRAEHNGDEALAAHTSAAAAGAAASSSPAAAAGDAAAAAAKPSVPVARLMQLAEESVKEKEETASGAAPAAAAAAK